MMLDKFLRLANTLKLTGSSTGRHQSLTKWLYQLIKIEAPVPKLHIIYVDVST